jgi:flagellin-specific chaperone FliS
MQLSDYDLSEFITLYANEFGETLEQSEAREIATRLIDLYTILMRRLPDEAEDVTEMHDVEAHPAF